MEEDYTEELKIQKPMKPYTEILSDIQTNILKMDPKDRMQYATDLFGILNAISNSVEAIGSYFKEMPTLNYIKLEDYQLMFGPIREIALDFIEVNKKFQTRKLAEYNKDAVEKPEVKIPYLR